MSEQTFLLIVATIMCIVFVVLLSFLSAVLWQLVKILREVRGIMANIRMGSDTFTTDLAKVRQQIINGVSAVAEKIGGVRTRKRTPTSPKTQADKEE